MGKRLQTAAGNVSESMSLTERQRVIVAVGVPVLFVVLFEITANFGVLILILAAGLAVFLYTRSTAQETVAAGAYGTGLLMDGLYLLELYWNGAQGSTEPLIGTATRVLWYAVLGTVLVVGGLWLRQTNR